MTHPEEIIALVPAWQGAQEIRIEPLAGGKTNQNYLLWVDGERFVLRVSGQNTSPLGISRATERDALVAAAGIGIAPEMIAFFLPEGHLITRFIDGVEWSPQEFQQPEVIARVAPVMRRVHALPPIAGVFDPYRDIENRLETARQRGLALPESLDAMLHHLHAIRQAREQALSGRLALCHNDPWHNNFLDDGSVRLLDWEFAGMGDPYFDLASIAAFHSPEQKQLLLDGYYGEAVPQAMQTLNDMIYVVMFWNATWALLQVGGEITEIDFAGMARSIFERLQREITQALP